MSDELPRMMRAARIHRYGGPEELVVEQAPLPSVGRKQLLIRVHAAAVNPIDWKIRGGAQRAIIRLKLPFILGMDLSGVVVAVGPEVQGFSVGDEVYSSPHHKTQGCYAEYVAVTASEVARRPLSISHVEAAGVPMVGLTAWRCLVTAGRLKAGQKVVITAGAGGVGSIAIQIAKALGAHVATTCSERNREYVESLGADEVIDYRTQRVDEVLSGYDLALDVYGGADTLRLRRVLERGGRLVTITGDLPRLAKRYGAVLGVAAM
ncbi:MAG: NADP-dependent oxidoreductase, partial [Myxococcales bacterium]|nr:NADP-dependent oxidoreductase [Myxococcales bacterium]